MKKNLAAALAVPTLFLIIAAASISSWKLNFPLNDDWAYAIPVRHLLAGDGLVLCDWAAATQITHILWGTLWTGIHGFNYGVLRLSTLFLASGAIFFFFLLLKELEADNKLAWLAAATLAFSPVYFLLSNSFMTDVPYLFWLILSLYLYARHLKSGAEIWLWAAAVSSCACYLTRQIGFFLPFGYTLLLLSDKSLNLSRKTLLRIWLLPALTIAGHALWFKFVHGPTWVSENYVFAATLKHLASPGRLFSDVLERTLAAAAETGFFLLPISAGFFPGFRQFIRRKSPFSLGSGAYLSVAALVSACTIYAALKGPMPWLENTLNATGLGTLTLGGEQFKAAGIFGMGWFRLCSTVLGILSAAALLAACFIADRESGAAVKRILRLLFFVCASQFAFSLLGMKFFDRYMLVLFPWLLAAAAFAGTRMKFSMPVSATFLVLAAALSWAGTTDYFAWNEAKWKAAASAAKAGISPEETAGGFDYNASFNYEKNMKKLKSLKPLRMTGEWEWQTMGNYRAVLSFSPPPAPFFLIGEAKYATPLSGTGGTVYLLRLLR
ncbi:MAG: phospholipid carrier-dependent glycosyltransferase [bacterium]